MKAPNKEFRTKLLADWGKIKDTDFWKLFGSEIEDKKASLLKHLTVRSNDREADLLLKGEISGLDMVSVILDGILNKLKELTG